jgi:hypothetical protein
VSGYGLGAGHPERHLIALRDELARRGVRCELEDRGVWPRLRIHCPGEGASAEFDNNVVAAPIAGRWFFFWPGAEPIGSVTRLAQAAERIADDLGLDGDPDDDGTGQPVASLAVWRTLRRAGAGISGPVRPGLVPGGRGWRSGPRPEPVPGEITTARISRLARVSPAPAHHQRDPRQHVLPEPSAPVTPAAATGHPARSHLQAGTR